MAHTPRSTSTEPLRTNRKRVAAIQIAIRPQRVLARKRRHLARPIAPSAPEHRVNRRTPREPNLEEELREVAATLIAEANKFADVDPLAG